MEENEKDLDDLIENITLDELISEAEDKENEELNEAVQFFGWTPEEFATKIRKNNTPRTKKNSVLSWIAWSGFVSRYDSGRGKFSTTKTEPKFKWDNPPKGFFKELAEKLTEKGMKQEITEKDLLDSYNEVKAFVLKQEKQREDWIKLHEDGLIDDETLSEELDKISKTLTVMNEGNDLEPDDISELLSKIDNVEDAEECLSKFEKKVKDGDHEESEDEIEASRKLILDKIAELKESEDMDDEEKENVSESIYKDDLNVLIEQDETLSEEFKEKAQIIFEAAVNSRIKEETQRLNEEFETRLLEESEKQKADLEEKVDNYLTYAVESWVEDNKIAIEGGLRTELAESFISALQNVFVEHYIEVPETKRDLVSELEKENDSLKESLQSKETEAKELNEQVETLTRERILAEATEDLADTQSARLRNLAEDIAFVDEETFAKKVSTLKECYFKGKSPTTEKKEPEKKPSPYQTTETVIVEGADNENLSPEMSAYLSALGRTNRKA